MLDWIHAQARFCRAARPPFWAVQPPTQRLHNKQRASRSREAGKRTIGNDAHKHHGRVRATRGHFQANLELLHPEAVALQPGISVHTTQSETKATSTRKDHPSTCSALRLHNARLPDGRFARRCTCCTPPCVRLRPLLTCGFPSRGRFLLSKGGRGREKRKEKAGNPTSPQKQK